MTIRVYEDAGVRRALLQTLLYELGAWKCAKISADEIIHTSWENECKLLIIPGGRDVAYHQALSGRGNNKIRTFVEKGGSFLGICAGGYYGSKYVEFDKGMPLEVIGDRELAFFPGIARGPAYGLGTYKYNSEQGAKDAHLSDGFFGGSFRGYFNGGCYFADAEKYAIVKTVSRFLDIPGEPAAIIACTVGSGKAILSGVHFEIGLNDPNTTLKGKMKETLHAYEPQRRQFFKHIVQQLVNPGLKAWDFFAGPSFELGPFGF